MRYFTNKENYYMTRKVSEEVNQELINIMLGMIEESNGNGIKLDYFKVFRFSNSLENG